MSILTNNGEIRDLPTYHGEDQTGKIFGKFTVLGLAGFRKFPRGHQCQLWKVKCSCGSIEERQAQNVRLNVNGCRSCAYAATKGDKSCHWKGGKYISGYFLSKVKKGAEARRSGRGIEFDLDIEYLDSLWESQNGKCKYTKIDLEIGGIGEETTASLDRINSSGGYVVGNVQFVHKDVNRVKWDLSEDKFLEICKMVVENYGK